MRVEYCHLEKGLNLLLVHHIKCNKAFENVIIEGCCTIEILGATGTMVLLSFCRWNDLEVFIDNFTIMPTSTVNHTVSLRYTFELTVFHRTVEHILFLLVRIGVSCLDVILKINLLRETTLTDRTHIREVVCMFLHMIMHR